MPSTTTRLGLIEPLGADAPSELRVSIANHATTLDVAVTITEGTAASRPASGSYYGQTYYATDTTVLSFWNGSIWMPVRAGGAWTSITLASGFVAATGMYTPQFRIEGDVVRMRGGVTITTGINQNTNISTAIPAAATPASDARPIGSMVTSGGSWVSAPLRITTANLFIYMGSSQTGTNTVSLDGVTYTVS